MLDVRNFYKATNPSKTLDITNTQDQKYYTDFSTVRGGKLIEELLDKITFFSADEATCDLFTGHIGSGKSTELLRLKAELEREGFHVVYFESSQDLEMGDVDISDILLAIARQVSQSLENIKINIKPSYFAKLFQDIGDFLQTPIELSAEAELSLVIGKLTAKTKEAPKLRDKLRDYLEPRTSSVLQCLNQELLTPAIAALKRQGKNGLVVIVDNLDRVDNTQKPSGRPQPEYLFVDRGEQLSKLDCHVVYTMPLALIFSNDAERLTERFGGDPKVLPMVSVRLREGRECAEGMKLLRQMVLARAFPDFDPQQRLQTIPEIFDNPETLDRLCHVSGGHVRNLLRLLNRWIQLEKQLPLSRERLDDVIRERRNQLSLRIDDQEWDLLRQVAQSKQVSGDENYNRLIRSMFVFEYRDRDGSWFDINPILLEAKQLQL
jgi:hypothetical protein